MDLVNQSVLPKALLCPPIMHILPMARNGSQADSSRSLEGRLLFAVPKSEHPDLPLELIAHTIYSRGTSSTSNS